MLSLSALVTCRHPFTLGTGIMHGCCSFSAARGAWRTTSCCTCACLVAAGRWQAPCWFARESHERPEDIIVNRTLLLLPHGKTQPDICYPASTTGWIPNLRYSLPSALNHVAALQTMVSLSNCRSRLHGWLILWNLTAFLLSPFQRRQAWWAFR